MKRLSLITLAVLSFLAVFMLSSEAQGEYTPWRTFTTADGLAFNQVVSIFEDQDGNLWFGTVGGLSRYNGASWKTFSYYRATSILQDMRGHIWINTTFRKAASRYDGTSWRDFTTADGLASDQVNSILEDQEGNLWFGTAAGVSCYDGDSLQTFTAADGLAADMVRYVFQDREGILWFGTDGGVSRYDGDSWRTFTTADGLANGSVRFVLQDKGGSLWFATDNGVSRYDGARFRTYTTADGLVHDDVKSILEDREGNLWFVTDAGVSRYNGASWEAFTAEDGVLGEIVLCAMQDSRGGIWFGTLFGLSRYDGTRWTTFTVANGLPHDSVRAILEDREGNVWFGTDGGVSRYDGDSWRTFTTADGLVNDYVTSILEDREGNLWLVPLLTITKDGELTAGGVNRYDGDSLQTFTAADGLASDVVNSILEDREGSIWFATGNGATRYNGASWKTFTVADGMAHNEVRSFLEDQEGNLWFLRGATWWSGPGSGVTRYDGTSWKTFTTADGLASDQVNSILEDQEGNLWFGTLDAGVSRYDGKSWRTFNAKNSGLTGNRVDRIVMDSQGNLWANTWTKTNDHIYTSAGVSRYDGTSWRTFTTADGLAFNHVVFIFEDRDSRLWLATYVGVSRYHGNSWRTFTTADGLASNHATYIMQDREGRLWFGTEGSGVSCYDGNSWATFTAHDGLASNYVNLVFEDQDGNLWFGTRSGLTRHIPSKVPPWTQIESVSVVGGASYLPQETLFLQYLENNLIIAFSGGDMKTEPEDLRFLYKLEGYDRDWRSTTKPLETTVEYFDLPSGSYTFLVKARDTDLNYTDSPPSMEIVIQSSPPIPVATGVGEQAAPASEAIVNLPLLGRMPLFSFYALVGLVVVLTVVCSSFFSHLQATRRVRQAVERKFNPYVYGEPIRSDDMFYGRDELLERVMRVVHRNSIMIHGERRIGKTSVLYQLAARLERIDDPEYLFIPILIDLEGTLEATFFHTLMEEISEGCQPYLTQRPRLRFDEVEHDYSDRYFGRDLGTIIKQLKRDNDKEIRVVLLMDEVDVISNYRQPQLIQQQLRRVLMRHFAKNLGVIVSGVEIRREWERRESPFYNLFNEIKLASLDREEALKLITEPVKGIYEYDQAAIEFIIAHSDLKPHLIQKFCLEAVNRILDEGRTRVTEEDVKHVDENVVLEGKE